MPSGVMFVTTTHRIIKKRHSFTSLYESPSLQSKNSNSSMPFIKKSRKERNLFNFSIGSERKNFAKEPFILWIFTHVATKIIPHKSIA